MVKTVTASLITHPIWFLLAWTFQSLHIIHWVLTYVQPKVNRWEYYSEKTQEKNRTFPRSAAGWSDLVRDLWFNLLCAAVGWAAAFVLVEIFARIAFQQFCNLSVGAFSAFAFGAIVTLLGVTGRLPQATQRFAERLGGKSDLPP